MDALEVQATRYHGRLARPMMRLAITAVEITPAATKIQPVRSRLLRSIFPAAIKPTPMPRANRVPAIKPTSGTFKEMVLLLMLPPMFYNRQHDEFHNRGFLRFQRWIRGVGPMVSNKISLYCA